MSYQKVDWFEHQFGFKESLAAVKEHISVEEVGDHIEIVSDVNKRRIKAGQFNIRFLPWYKERPMAPRGNGKFFLIHGHAGLGINEVMVNINDPSFNGATFQVASNFNCLDYGSYKKSAANGIKSYASDWTQGPPAACAAAGAIMYRNYFVPHDGIIGQVDGDINLLCKTPIRTYHGKAFICEPEDFERNKGFDFKNEDLYGIGVHENVEVTTDRDGPDMLKDSRPDTFVHQIFCSTLNMGGTAKRCPETFGIVEQMLLSLYKATILAAWDLSLRYPGRPGSNKLVLTAVGGASFRNPKEMICNAVVACRDLIIASGLEVYFACFDDRAFDMFGPLLMGLCQETGGKVIDT